MQLGNLNRLRLGARFHGPHCSLRLSTTRPIVSFGEINFIYYHYTTAAYYLLYNRDTAIAAALTFARGRQ